MVEMAVAASNVNDAPRLSFFFFFFLYHLMSGDARCQREKQKQRCHGVLTCKGTKK